MNNTIKYVLCVIGVIAFIEIQVLMYFTIRNNTNTNINNTQPPVEMNSTNREFNRGNGMSAPGGGMNDISENAITPGEDNSSSNSDTTTNTSDSSTKSSKKTKTTSDTNA
jgi:cytoskeletal protein RodZ